MTGRTFPLGRLTLACGAAAVLNLAALAAWARSQPPLPRTVLEPPARLAILAAHQDDCVLMGGGTALQTLAAGGEVSVVYLTRADSEREAQVRRAEAIQAWRLAGVDSTRLHFLDFPSRMPSSRQPAARQGLDSLLGVIRPDLVIVPTAEHGHDDHDLLAHLGREAALAAGTPRLLHAVEYNPYLLAETAPAKVLAFLARLAPGVPYVQPNVGVDRARVSVLRMTPLELARKRDMLEAFASQRGVVPVDQFGYPDTFEATETAQPVAPVWTMRVGAKRLSAWTIATLALLGLALTLAGLFVGTLLRRPVAIAVAGTAILLLAWHVAAERTRLKEDGLAALPLTLGLSVGSLAPRRHPTRRAD